jgi:hypothetical protein
LSEEPAFSPRICGNRITGAFFTTLPNAYPKNPKFVVAKFARFGKMAGRSVFATPNHDASVAAY